MADVAELFFLHLNAGASDEDSDSDSDSILYRSHFISDSPLDLDRSDSPDPFTQALDSAVFDSGTDMGSDYLGLGGGLSFGLDSHDFFLSRSLSPEPSDPPPPDFDGLRIIDIDSDSDSETEIDDAVEPFAWDSLRLEGENRADFEWEEIETPNLNERDVLSMMVGPNDSDLDEGTIDGDVHVNVEIVRNIGWEVLVTDGFEDGEYREEESVDSVNTSDFEILAAQIDSAVRGGSPPAARSAVASLPTIKLTEEDVRKSNNSCAVCKDDISLDVGATQLPCLHHYHKDCILPWLGIRNTCPVCRYELPTDDPDYENMKARRADGFGLVSF